MGEEIVSYLIETVDSKLQLEGTTVMDVTRTIILESFNTTEYAANRVDRKSVDGGVICLNRMIVG